MKSGRARLDENDDIIKEATVPHSVFAYKQDVGVDRGCPVWHPGCSALRSRGCSNGQGSSC
jgi:hypothetical protein